MIYVLLSIAAFYFAQKYLIKALERRPNAGGGAKERELAHHAEIARRHLYFEHVFRFFGPLKTEKYVFGSPFSAIDFKLLTSWDAACIFIAQKIWCRIGQDENAPTREVFDRLLDTVARQLQDIEDSVEFRQLPAAVQSSPAQPSVRDYVYHSGNNVLPPIPLREIQDAFYMCFAAAKIIQSKFDEKNRAKMQSLESIPGVIDELESFLHKREDDVALFKKIVMLDGYAPGKALTPAQRYFQLEQIFSAMAAIDADDAPISVKRQHFDRLTPSKAGPQYVVTAYMAKYFFKRRDVTDAEHAYDMLKAFDQRIRTDRIAAARETDLQRFSDIMSHYLHVVPRNDQDNHFLDERLGPLTDHEILVLAGLAKIPNKYEFDREPSEIDKTVIPFAQAEGLVEELERQLELATRERKMPKEKLAALLAEKMEKRLERDPLSVVLRPQVPIRFDETPRSWLGGLPHMPDSIVWPRGGANSLPMHFAAQICCADLPQELWCGHGPREGWLLLFIDGYRMGNYDGFDGDYPDGWSKVIHIDELGPERSPPDDILGVSDPHYAGADYDDALDETDIPTIWRKWPIDIVPQKIELEPGKVVSFVSRSFALKSTTGKELYGVDDSEISDRLIPEECPPLTWGGALSFTKCAIKEQRRHANATYLDKSAELRTTPGWTAPLISGLEEDLRVQKAQLDQAKRRLSKAVEEQSGRERYLLDDIRSRSERIVQQEETLALLLQNTEERAERALSEKITHDAETHAAWWAEQAGKLDDLLIKIKAHGQYAYISTDEWAHLFAQLSGIRRSFLRIGVSKDGGLGRARLIEDNVVDRAWPESVVRQHYLDVYAHSSATRDLIPKETQEIVAKIVREVKWGRPHRMGGLADPLQSDMGPDDPPLLFQIASDDTLNWMWGDAGAIFIHTTEQELADREFSVFANMECH